MRYLFDLSDTLGSWFLCGIIFGVGFVVIIIAAVKIADYFSERYPSKKKREQEIERQQRIVKERNLILIPWDLYHCIFFTKGKAGGFQKSIEEMRKEFWQKDIIVPYFRIEACSVNDMNGSLIKVDGNLIYSESLLDEQGNTSPEQAEALLIQKLRDYFTSQINSYEKKEVAEIE